MWKPLFNVWFAQIEQEFCNSYHSLSYISEVQVMSMIEMQRNRERGAHDHEEIEKLE